MGRSATEKKTGIHCLASVPGRQLKEYKTVTLNHSNEFIPTRWSNYSQVYCLSFKYSSTCFGYLHAHLQELQQLRHQPLVYRWNVVVAVLLVVVGPAGPTTTNSTAITTFQRQTRVFFLVTK